MMTPVLRRGASKLIMSYRSPSINLSKLIDSIRFRTFSSIDGNGGSSGSRRQSYMTEGRTPGSAGKQDNAFATDPAGLGDHDIVSNDNRCRDDKWRTHNTGRRPNPPEPIPSRPLRGEKPIYQSGHFSRGNNGLRSGGRGYEKSTTVIDTNNNLKSKPVGMEGNRTGRQSPSTGSGFSLFNELPGNEVKEYSRPQPSRFGGEKQGYDFLEKFKFGFEEEDKVLSEQEEMEEGSKRLPPPAQDADEIFRKMKENGLIPNAVAMLDGLCKDGLLQEAMKLFGLMREKGTIPEIVIYTAVVDGFCKAHKLDDAKRIFRKMQDCGISPNAFSYTVLIQGLYKCNRLEDALDFCVEMLEAGHSPNLATFTGLVDGFCREKGLEEARSIIGTLRQKGFFFDEKAIREFLDKKGPFLPLVWEAIFEKKKGLQRSF